MLTRRHADGLAIWAGRSRRDGTRGLVARWALRRLVEAGDRGERAAVGAVWQAWLRHPEDALWEPLTRWLGPVTACHRADDHSLGEDLSTHSSKN